MKKYLAVNITKPPSEIVISDLNLVISPKQAILLNKVRTIHEIKSSVNLRTAINQKQIEIRGDVLNFEEEEKEPVKSNNISKEDIQNIKNSILEEIKKEMKNNSQNSDMQTILQELKKISVNSNNNVNVNNSDKQDQKNDETFQDSDKFIKIQSKKISNLTKDTESNISLKKESTNNNDIANQLSELQDLDSD